jgi:hypothetical protein
MLADQGVRLSDWKLREESAGDSRQAGGEWSRQSGDPADGGRPDAGQQHTGADAMNQQPGYGQGGSRSRSSQPAERWAAGTAPLEGPRQPSVGPAAAGSGRRLDLYA